jgi:hypothetical protein
MSKLFNIVSGLTLLACSSAANAIVVTTDTNANSLANTLTDSGITVTSSTLTGASTSSGTYTNASGTYGIGDGVILSSGNVNDYGDGPNNSGSTTTSYGTAATPAQEALLDPITGGSYNHNDVTQLDLTFNAGDQTSSIFFNVVFGSEEYPEWTGSSFIDAFGIYLNGVNIATFNSDPVNIDHPSMESISGTELDGILDPTNLLGDPIMLFEGLVDAGSIGNTLTFIIADSGDTAWDSTVYIAGLGSSNPGGGTPGGGNATVPEPGTLALLTIGLIGFGATRRKRKTS